jgi:RimJ/RimL family protein N-acetyltransferase
MSWTFTRDVEAYAAAAGELLGAEPTRHTVSLTVIETARAHRVEDEIYGWWTARDGQVAGAVSHTPGHALLLGVVPDEAVQPLVDGLRTTGRDIGGVNGPAALAGQFAAVWSAGGGRAELGGAMRLFRLGTLRPPEPPPTGKARPATDADLDLLTEWVGAFNREAAEPAADARRSAEDRLGFGGWTLWDDGEPVSLVGRSRMAAGTIRIAPVYTPPEFRRRGYAAAATVAASQSALDAGAAEVVLFTDLTNPTSNALYRRIGYEPMQDRLTFQFLD